MEFLTQLANTVVLRPYVFIFLAAFLFAAVTSMGLFRTLVFFFGTWVLAFLSEYSSTRTGFPYGLYHYTGITEGRELYISNVPFMDSLSYTFLLFASFSMARLTLAPLDLGRFRLRLSDTFALRQGWRAAVLTALYMMMVDFVIDPVAVHGDRWFLGRIYYYDEPGAYFGVPLTNAMGWFLVSAAAILLYQGIEKRFLGAGFRDIGVRRFRLDGLFGVGLYYGVLAFILSVAFWIGEAGVGIAGIFIFLLPTVLLVLKVMDPRAGATEAEVRKHEEELVVSSGKNPG